MCRVGDYNRTHASLTSPEALGRLRRLRQDNPELYAELTQLADAVTTVPDLEIEEPPFFEHDVYDDCDIPLKVVSGLVVGSSSVTAGFTVSENGGLARTGDAEKSDAEEEPALPPAPLGRGQRKKIATSRYQGPLWEEH